jgi:hypothetical protein
MGRDPRQHRTRAEHLDGVGSLNQRSDHRFVYRAQAGYVKYGDPCAAFDDPMDQRLEQARAVRREAWGRGVGAQQRPRSCPGNDHVRCYPRTAIPQREGVQPGASRSAIVAIRI